MYFDYIPYPNERNGFSMKSFYEKFCNFEEMLANALLMIIAVLVFLGAIARTVKHPLNWTSDIALLAFAWQVFIGGDIAVRNTKLVGIDMLINHFPNTVRKWMSVVFSVIMIAFLAILTYFGFILVLESTQRLMNTLTISYAWCTLAVPVGALLMMISSTLKMVECIKTPAEEWR